MHVDALDHLVLTVADIAATCRFYEAVLGLETVTFAGGRTALQLGRQKINLHEAGNEIAPHAARPPPGSADLCFVSAYTSAEVHAHLRAQGIDILEGPVPRTGATGPISSVYCRDPDGNLVEIASYAG